MAIVKTVVSGIHSLLPLVMAGGISAATFGYYTGNTHAALISGAVGVGAGVVHEIGIAFKGKPHLTKAQKLQAKQAKYMARLEKLKAPKPTPAEKLQQKIADAEAKAAQVSGQPPPNQ